MGMLLAAAPSPTGKSATRPRTLGSSAASVELRWNRLEGSGSKATIGASVDISISMTHVPMLAPTSTYTSPGLLCSRHIAGNMLQSGQCPLIATAPLTYTSSCTGYRHIRDALSEAAGLNTCHSHAELEFPITLDPSHIAHPSPDVFKSRSAQACRPAPRAPLEGGLGTALCTGGWNSLCTSAARLTSAACCTTTPCCCSILASASLSLCAASTAWLCAVPGASTRELELALALSRCRAASGATLRSVERASRRSSPFSCLADLR
mmetsp:Transcript_16719/g.40857  ORF Transcript_16719/g.40857 Transcript_16719/m.40857 type:complete len:265 (+) Transcript_16719:217-1011(+)